MKISLVVVVDEMLGIGRDNKLLCHLPADLKYFKRITMGHAIIMGRKTFESIGKALTGRTNIVVTSDKSLVIPGCVMVHSIEEALQVCRKNNETEAFFIGGAQVFNQIMPVADKIYLTLIHEVLEADTFFPEPDIKHWKETSAEFHYADEKNPYDYSFKILERVD
jgi:dihydrofolate reductase